MVEAECLTADIERLFDIAFGVCTKLGEIFLIQFKEKELFEIRKDDMSCGKQHRRFHMEIGNIAVKRTILTEKIAVCDAQGEVRREIFSAKRTAEQIRHMAEFCDQPEFKNSLNLGKGSCLLGKIVQTMQEQPQKLRLRLIGSDFSHQLRKIGA